MSGLRVWSLSVLIEFEWDELGGFGQCCTWQQFDDIGLR
jgi:hypothetical protein